MDKSSKTTLLGTLLEISSPSSHCKWVLVFSQINIGFEFRINSLVEFSSLISQLLCYFKSSYYFSVVMKINEQFLQLKNKRGMFTQLWELPLVFYVSFFKEEIKIAYSFSSLKKEWLIYCVWEIYYLVCKNKWERSI